MIRIPPARRCLTHPLPLLVWSNLLWPLPNDSMTNLMPSIGLPQDLSFGYQGTNQTAFDSLFGSGNYVFNVVASTSNQSVTVNLPASLGQPAAPHVANYAAAQSVNPAAPFTLQWDAFAGGTSTDYVSVDITGVYNTATAGASNALPGTATSVTIPAGTFRSNTTYLSTIGFYPIIDATNGSSYTTAAIRSCVTQFNLITSTTGGATAPLVLTNASWSRPSHTFTFSGASATNQAMTIQYNTNLGLASSTWKTLLTTNSSAGVIQVSDTVNTTGPHVFYRAQASP
jgi:hypothetical protein